MILVTGATGNVGVELVKRLSAVRQPVRAFVRNRAVAQSIALPHVEFVEGDFTKPDSFPAALDGTDRLFLLIPSSADVEQQQRDFVDAAQRSNVRHIVKLSQLGADENSAGRFQRYHRAVEKHIVKSGIPFTFLRPNLFMQGLLHFRPAIASEGVFYAPAGRAKVSVVDVRDIASVAAKVLTETGHVGKVYEITGPEAITHEGMANLLAHALGKSIGFVNVPPEAMKEALLASGMPEWQAAGLVEDYENYRSGEAAIVTSTVKEITGAEPTSFFQFAKDYAGKFRGKAAGAA